MWGTEMDPWGRLMPPAPQPNHFDMVRQGLTAPHDWFADRRAPAPPQLPPTVVDMVGGLLPAELRRKLAPWGAMLNPLEWTPGVAVRDAVDASAATARAALNLDPWGFAAGTGAMGLSLLGIGVPPARRVGKALMPKALPPATTPSERLSVEQALRLRPIAVTMNDQGVSGILRDKQFKSQFETGYSGGGLFNPDKRRQFEANYLGLPPHTPDAKRPIYGTVGLAPQMLSVRPYGDYTFLLKPEVKQRSTYTLGDSLDSRLKGKAWNRRGSGELATRAAFPYLEAQISRLNQPLLLGDVDRVLMTRPDMNAYRTLDRVGIPYDLMPHRIAQRPGSPEWVDWWRQFGLMAPPLTLGGLWATANQGAAGEWP